ncbi:MAG TPA: hypothetical protein VFL82_09075, partial [Thermomicrobiales bacterium]|nr:hypothetical protein [Thermomicrobiales bacterium]
LAVLRGIANSASEAPPSLPVAKRSRQYTRMLNMASNCLFYFHRWREPIYSRSSMSHVWSLIAEKNDDG